MKGNLYLLIIFYVVELHHCLCFTSYIFGDSLVDVGNNDYLFTLSKADSPPYGIDFGPSGGRPTGRFTNGRTISDIVGQAFGAKTFPPPYLAPNTRANALLEGLNYASGASGILDTTGSLFIGRIPLRQQVNNFAQSRNYMAQIMGENDTSMFLRDAIFSITIGSNDVLNYFQPSLPFFEEDNVPSIMFQDFMVSNFTMQLMRLHRLGARKYIIVGVGPLGCIPFIRATKLIPSGRCSVEVNQLIRGYNDKLKLKLRQLNRQLGPDSIFVYANSYDVVMKIIQNYRHYGFENVNGPCCGGYFPPFICFKGNGSINSSALCDDRSKYVFWDAYHPTEAANVVIAKRFLDGGESINSPINIRELYDY